MTFSLQKLFAGNGREEAIHADAEQFMKTVSGEADVDYDWVSDFANDLWEYRVSIYKGLDEKADSIIKYLGGGTGLFVIGVLSKIDVKNAYVAAWALPAVFMAVIAVMAAILTRIPKHGPSLPSVKVAKEYADREGDKKKALAAFLGQWHVACEYMRVLNDKKARIVRWATWLYWIAIALLSLPLVIAIYFPPI